MEQCKIYKITVDTQMDQMKSFKTFLELMEKLQLKKMEQKLIYQGQVVFQNSHL